MFHFSSVTGHLSSTPNATLTLYTVSSFTKTEPNNPQQCQKDETLSKLFIIFFCYFRNVLFDQYHKQGPQQRMSLDKTVYIIKYKPAAQAAGADPSQCNFTNRQNSPIQLNCHNY